MAAPIAPLMAWFLVPPCLNESTKPIDNLGGTQNPDVSRHLSPNVPLGFMYQCNTPEPWGRTTRWVRGLVTG